MSDRSPRTSEGTNLAATGRYLSIDAEDIVVSAAELHRTQVPAGYKDNFGDDVRRTLEILDATGALATFFVNGRYCEQNDDLMKEVVARGHILATHGHYHYDVRELTVAEFNDDLRRSLDALGKYQSSIVGYRPPAFTMPFDDDHLRVLTDNGLKYVSCGALFQRANVPHHDKPARLPCGLVYVPVSIAYGLGRLLKYPVGYGHVSRLLPERFVIANLRRF
jgi:peptidoglycan/xylan/chitin deacetylase (PgdA/CDA1 family)